MKTNSANREAGFSQPYNNIWYNIFFRYTDIHKSQGSKSTTQKRGKTIFVLLPLSYSCIIIYVGQYRTSLILHPYHTLLILDPYHTLLILEPYYTLLLWGADCKPCDALMCTTKGNL